jgi:hypothetical protein
MAVVGRISRKTVSQRITWVLVVLFSFAVLPSHGCRFGMTLDEVYFLLRYNYSSSAWILHLAFQGIPYVSGHHCATNIWGLLAVVPYMATVLAVAALSKGSLRSV